jgi:hypothetical protein
MESKLHLVGAGCEIVESNFEPKAWAPEKRPSPSLGRKGMPLDQLLIPDMPELFYTAVRALNYCEHTSDQSPEGRTGLSLLDASRPAFSQRKQFQPPASFPGWLRHLLGGVWSRIVASTKAE